MLFADGSGAGGATVSLGELSTACDSRGRFALEIVEEESPETRLRPGTMGDAALVAYLDGWTPGVVPGVGERVRAAATSASLAPVEVVLASRALAIDGTVIGRDGGPAAGWRIALLDGVPAFRDDYRPFTAEEVSAGTRGHLETGVDGGFAFTGLFPGREYRVRAWNPRTLEQVTSDPIPSGTRGRLLRVSGFGLRPVVDGVAVALDGTPLADMGCRLSMVEYELDGGQWMTTGQAVRTDGSGRFEFRDVPACPVFIRVDGQVGGARRDLAPDDPGRDLVIEVEREGSFDLVLRDPGRAPDALKALDALGEPLQIECFTAPGRSRSGSTVRIPPGGAHEWRVSERAQWLVLVAGGRDLARLPLVVRPGETAHVVW